MPTQGKIVKKKLISTYRIIQNLKKSNELPLDFNNFAHLPKDPDQKIILVHVDSRFMIPFWHTSFLKAKIGGIMNYSQMVEAVREGKHCRRPTWGAQEKVWSNGTILIHSNPYFGESFNQLIQGYVYVCEQVDVVATDWEVLSV